MRVAAHRGPQSSTGRRAVTLKLMSIKSVMPSSHLILCHPLLLLPPILPSIRLFVGFLRQEYWSGRPFPSPGPRVSSGITALLPVLLWGPLWAATLMPCPTAISRKVITERIHVTLARSAITGLAVPSHGLWMRAQALSPESLMMPAPSSSAEAPVSILSRAVD